MEMGRSGYSTMPMLMGVGYRFFQGQANGKDKFLAHGFSDHLRPVQKHEWIEPPPPMGR